MGLITNLVMATLGGGGLKIFANHLLAIRKIADERAKQIDERADGYTDKLSERVSELEAALATERRECDKALDTMRVEMRTRDEQHHTELRAVQMQVDGLVKQIVQFQTSTARAMALTPSIQHAVDRVAEIRSGGD